MNTLTQGQITYLLLFEGRPRTNDPPSQKVFDAVNGNRGAKLVTDFIKKVISSPYTIDVRGLNKSRHLWDALIEHLRSIKLYKLGLSVVAPTPDMLLQGAQDENSAYTDNDMWEIINFFDIKLNQF